MFDAEFDRCIVVRYFGEQVTNAINLMKTGDDPLVRAFISINDGPNMVGVVVESEL